MQIPSKSVEWNWLERLVGFFSPPALGHIKGTVIYAALTDDEPLDYDGVLWRAYDVRATGIEKYRWGAEQMTLQTREAQHWLAREEDRLRAEGWTNTIHDCWEERNE